jgi:hypothetical protein
MYPLVDIFPALRQLAVIAMVYAWLQEKHQLDFDYANSVTCGVIQFGK